MLLIRLMMLRRSLPPLRRSEMRIYGWSDGKRDT